MMQPYRLKYVRRYLGGAGPSEKELLDLALRYTSPSQIPNTHPHPPSPPPPNLAFGLSPSILCTYGHGALNTSRVL